MDVQTLKALIFDFDGTLVRSHRQVFEVIVELTKDRCPPPTSDDLRRLNTKDLLKRLNVATWAVPWFVWRARRRLTARLDELEFEPGLIKTLNELRARGYRLAVVSSNSTTNVRRVLRRHGVTDLFKVVLGGSSLLGKHRTLSRAIRALHLPVDEVLSVGDEERDLEAADRLGLKSIAVGWGFHDGARLRAHGPWGYVENPAELIASLPESVR